MMKKINYSILVLLITLISTFLITTYGRVTISETSSSSEDAYAVDDMCVDAFIKTYAEQILKTDQYEITAENREKIRSLISAMGRINVARLKNAIYSGSLDKITKGVCEFADNNFLNEEKELISQYILSN